MKTNWRLVGALSLCFPSQVELGHGDLPRARLRAREELLRPCSRTSSHNPLAGCIGRLIGVLGADKSLMSGSGMASRLRLTPPTSGTHHIGFHCREV